MSESGVKRSEILHHVDLDAGSDEVRRNVSPKTPIVCLACIFRRRGKKGSECTVGGDPNEVRAALVGDVNPNSPATKYCPQFRPRQRTRY